MVMKMENYNYLFFYHFVVMSGKWFNRVKTLKAGTEYSSDSITDESWNYFVPNDCYNLLLEAKVKNGTYNLCIPSYIKGKEQLDYLLTNEPYNYNHVSRESWFTKNEPIELKYNDNYKVIKASNDNEKKQFIDCFNKAYGAPVSDMNAYGELSNEYANSMQEFDFFSKELDGYLLIVNDTVVSSCLVCNFGAYSGIYALGTDPKYQGNGYGKYLMSVITNTCLENKQRLFFQTETDTKTEEMYLKMGFNKIFTCDYYKKGDENE